MTAEEYVQAHGDTFVKWLQDNTVECACEDKYGCDESKRHCETIDAETEITEKPPFKLRNAPLRRGDEVPRHLRSGSTWCRGCVALFHAPSLDLPAFDPPRHS